MSAETKTALITGAAGGLGRAFAESLVAEGWRIVAVDRVEHGGDNVMHIACDLADPLARERLLPAIVAAGPFDLVIHNAGVSATGAFSTIPAGAYQRLVQVNCEAPIVLTAALMREKMIASGGALLFIASLSHFTGYPGAAVYAASKDALVAYAASIRRACAAMSVSVSVAYPGPLRTGHAARHAPPDTDEARRMEPAVAARLILDGAYAGRRTIVPGNLNRLHAIAGRLLPRIATMAMRRLIYERLSEARW